MKKTENSEKLNSLIKDYKLIEEYVFISRISDIASENRNLVTSKMNLLLGNPSTEIHLKYLLIKIIGNLKYQNFIPLLSGLLRNEEKDRIINEILNSLTNIVNIESYKVVTSFFSTPKNKRYLPKFNGYLKIFYGKSPLIYHFDVFFRDRGDVKDIEISSNFLINNLEQTYFMDLLPAIFSKYSSISFEALKLFEKKPGPLFYNSINDIFLTKYADRDELYYKQLVKTLFKNASTSPHKKIIYIKLKDHLDILSGKRRNFFVIFLLKLNTKDLINEALGIYKELEIDEKILFFNNLDANSYTMYKGFIKKKFIEETNERILLRIILIFMLNNEYDMIFNITAKQKGARKENLLHLIIETKKENLSNYFSRFLSVSEENNILISAIGYILSDNPDKYYESFKTILFSGVSINIKQKIIRNIKNFSNSKIKKFINSTLDKPVVLNTIEKDFLLMLISLKEKNIFNDTFLDKLLNYILTIMEEAGIEDIINYIFFFDSYEFNKPEHNKLIVDELKMIQNTLLKSSKNDNLVSMIYKLIKKIEI